MTQMPKKAVILAAGLGTRMRPLSFDTPKPLMPLWNRPLLDRVLSHLRNWGVRDILINLHHAPQAITEHLRHRTPDGLRIYFSFEPEILGTGGALRRAAWFLDRTPFWMVNADIAFNVDHRPLLRCMRHSQPLAVLWLTDCAGPRTVTMRQGWIRDFQSRTPGAPDNYTFTGLHLLSPQILQFLPPTGYASIIDAYEKAMAAGRRIAGICPPGAYWSDLGAHATYLAAHAATAPCRQKESFIAVAPDARIAPGADTARAVIWSGARLGPRAIVHDAIIGRNCAVNCHVPNIAVLADYLPHDAALQAALSHLGWPATDTAVIPLEPRGSARDFTRLAHGRQSVIMIQYRLERAENGWYARHTQLLEAAGVDVPRLLYDSPRKKIILMEDLGRETLENRIRRLNARRPADIRRLYQPVLDNLLRMHALDIRANGRPRVKMSGGFTPRLYKWEREFFVQQFLRRHSACGAGVIRSILAELQKSAAILLASPYTLIHRDMQSTNILYRGNTPCFIDFQGMRFGPAAYDLASLLCDPYVELPTAYLPKLLTYYNRHLPSERRIMENVFWHAAVERLAQALGAYGRLGAEPATRRFLRFIPPALRQMGTALQQLQAHPVLANTVRQLLEQTDNCIGQRHSI
jgi:NDP-sugar pyrophosphorylase family protein/aminoglycoside/choline kinase family phosphotransferase